MGFVIMKKGARISVLLYNSDLSLYIQSGWEQSHGAFYASFYLTNSAQVLSQNKTRFSSYWKLFSTLFQRPFSNYEW